MITARWLMAVNLMPSHLKVEPLKFDYWRLEFREQIFLVSLIA